MEERKKAPIDGAEGNYETKESDSNLLKENVNNNKYFIINII